MNVLGELVWKITGDNSGLDKSLKKTDAAVKDTGKSIDNTTGKVGGMSTALKVGLAGAAIFAFSKLKQFFGGAIDAASDAAETAQKFGNVFPGITKKANATAKALTSVANVSLSESKALLATSGNLLQSIGATETTALSYGKELAKMAADLKSFNNLTESTEMIQQRLTKALLGEREALIGVDIKLSEKDLAAYAQTQGIVWKNATRLQKAEVTLAALRDKSRLATDDVIKSSGTYAQVTRALANRQKDLSEDVGKEMLPALTDLKKAFLESSGDGGFLYNALILIGKAVGKVIQGITIFVKTLNVIQAAISDTITGISEFNKAAEESGNQAKGYKLLAAAQGDVGKALAFLKLEAENGDKASQKFLQQLNKNQEKSQATTKKTEDAIKSLEVATSKFYGTYKEGEKTSVKGFNNVSNSINNANTASQKLAKTWNQLTSPEKFDVISSGVLSVADAVVGMLSAIDSFTQASADAASERLEIDRQNALEAAGVAEETTLQKAQRELEIAKEKGDAELIQEKETEVKRAKINEEYDKKQAELDYNANLRSWELQIAMAKIQMITAPLNAYVSALATPVIGPYIAPGLAALAAITAGYQFAAVQESKPTRPRYAEGGIIPGTPSGTEIIAGENNKDEIIMNQNQMANTLMAIANGGGSGKEIVIHNYIMLEGEMIDEYVTRSSTDGRILSSSRATVRR